MNRRNFLLLAAVSPLMAKDYLTRSGDVYLTYNDLETLKSVKFRLGRLKRFVGFGNFNYLSFDRALFYGRNYSRIGQFTKSEIVLIEKLFYTNPSQFGFYGKQTVSKITEKISRKDLEKISHSGHFIYKGKPLDDYTRIIKDVGSDLILTSGVRSVMKQLDLYCGKIIKLNGNLTAASTIIAPPAYSYHAISDFDVGKKSWGYKNFTSAFATTEEYKEIRKLDYVKIRYIPNNKDGVRYEPWHIKVI